MTHPISKPTQLSRRGLMAMGLAAGTAWTLAACGEKKPAETAAAPVAPASAPAAAAPAGRAYVVGTDAAYAPFESQGPGGDIVGFDIDVLNATAAKAGISLKFVNTPWEGIFNTLASGERDMVISAVTITPERQQTMDFSAPYFDATQLIAVKAGSKVQKFDDLKTLKVGVQNGTTGDEVVQKLQGKASPNIRRFESTPLALKELESGGVDAVVADNGVVAHYIANNPAAQFVSLQDASFAPEQYGIAFKKGNAELQGKINTGLAAIRADGTYDAIYARYFGAKK
ncbi:basic amino acid ABC transporter substrate-binding protein [Hydrogenophaga sp.]|uniref:basic amino acid ABC transporter substrate-binding protein n=1 Tax=Hydrogenophaga sp. TaxID=1904254 RepID=UPI0039FD32B1